jgi:hypothetical protein
MASAYATPASAAFPLDHVTHYPRPEIPGYDLPNSSHICELYGWLIQMAGSPGNDPDWHFAFVPDPAWIDSTGADWSKYFTVGDILGMGTNFLTDKQTSMMGVAATPTWHGEVNGWRGADHPDACPIDWEVNSNNGGQLVEVVWPYLPTVSGGKLGGTPFNIDPHGPGPYVRIVGSIATDIPHAHATGRGVWEWTRQAFGLGSSGPYCDAAQAWGGDLDEHDPGHEARWTEIHPPDLIEVIDTRGPTETVYGITCIARSATLDPSAVQTEVTVALRPPGPQPTGMRVGIKEYVGPETNFSTITEGNPARNGAAITIAADHASAHVKVVGQPFDGVPGKFKAVYRLAWIPGDGSFPLTNLVGLSVADAVDSLKRAGLLWVVAETRTGGERPTVIGQEPIAGTLVSKGSRIGIVVEQPKRQQP